MNRHKKRFIKLIKEGHNDLVCSSCIYWVGVNYIDGSKGDTIICLKRIESRLRTGIHSKGSINIDDDWMMETHQTACLDFIER